MFTLKIKTDNAAFEHEVGDDYGAREECARILHAVADKLAAGYEEGPCMDSNGNRVGAWELTS